MTTVVNNPNPPDPAIGGAISQLAFYTQPGGGQGGQNLIPQPVVEVQDSRRQRGHQRPVRRSAEPDDANGNAVTNGATLTGCVGSENFGYVSFSGCNVNKIGTYTLKATDSALPPTYFLLSNPFTVTTGPPSQIVFTAAAEQRDRGGRPSPPSRRSPSRTPAATR